MDLFVERKLKFKAWNKDTRLMMRLNAIDCTKGELHKRDHILLQFTGFFDRDGEEIYDMDVLLMNHLRYVIHWNSEKNTWYIHSLSDGSERLLEKDTVRKGNRLCSYFETNS
jgi:hypothetical protein